jgi:hypothetical protein
MLTRRSFLLNIPMIAFSSDRNCVVTANDGIDEYEITVKHDSEERMLKAALHIFPKAMDLTITDIVGHKVNYNSIIVLNVRFWFRTSDQQFITFQTISPFF